MTKPYVYITRKLPEAALQGLRRICDVHMWPEADQAVPREVLLAEARHADALITVITEKIDEDVLARAERLQVVANIAVGYDNIDIQAAKKYDVTITNTPDVLNDTTADLAFSLLMATARRLVEAADYIKQDQWQLWSPFQLAGLDVHHKTLGIVGMGRIGETVAKRAQGFDMNILYHNRHRKPEAEQALGVTYASFTELLAQADFVVCLAPLTEDTKEMFSAQTFREMQEHAVFINVARGGLVNEADLEAAVRDGVIAGAGLDVFQQEPINRHHSLLKYKNVVALPHIGSSSMETRQAMIDLACQNVEAVLQGQKAKTAVV